MTVVNPKSISGINSITMASGSDDLLTIHSNNTTERVRVNNSGDVIVGSGVTLSPDGDAFFTGVCTATSFVGSGANLTGISGVSVANQSDNRLITATGTTDALNGESGATYDGTDFTVSSGRLKLTDESSGDQLRIGAAGDFTIEHDGSNTYLKNITNDLSIQNDANVKITAKTGGTERFKVDSNGDATVSNGNLVIGTAGKGIDFSAASGSGSGSTSALLDDYEEGTFTPIMHSNSGGGANATYSAQSGRYTKIGRIVHIRYDIQWTGWTNASGQLNVDNLPFVNEGVGSSGGYGAPQVRDPSGVDSNIRIYGNSSYIGNSLNRIRLLAYNSSGTEVSCTANSSGRMTGEAIMYVSV